MAIKAKATPPPRNPQEPKVKLELEMLRQLVPLDNMSRNSLRHIIEADFFMLDGGNEHFFALNQPFVHRIASNREFWCAMRCRPTRRCKGTCIQFFQGTSQNSVFFLFSAARVLPLLPH